MGLSPRLRGNRAGLVPRPHQCRSIPAPAGEPRTTWSCSSWLSVYPRACGGTAAPSVTTASLGGLSPRLRGNLGPAGASPGQPRSIPAPAGEPAAMPARHSSRTVYPRACGGTCTSATNSARSCGLSPRLRGNRMPSASLIWSTGSIPAPAGEPSPRLFRGNRTGVYPRACGGTSTAPLPASVSIGLSPRLRGNLDEHVHLITWHRSIPAPAGEPEWHHVHHGDARVYPRACGGTQTISETTRPVTGLSPRLRGNLRHFHRRVEAAGSIPAPAGEPFWVY